MINLADLTDYDAIFIRSLSCPSTYDVFGCSDWGLVLSFFLDDYSSGLAKEIDNLINRSKQSVYTHGIEISYENGMIKMEADEDYFDQKFSESVFISIQDLEVIVSRWKELLKEHPPVITLHKVDGKITLTPRYDIILD